MVLELKVPRGADFATLSGLFPIFLSFVNLHLLFWLSVFPFSTAWMMGQNQFALLAAIPRAFVNPCISNALYIVVALWWVVPDRRIQRALAQG